MIPVLIAVSVLAIGSSIYLTINSIKLKAKVTKLEIESNNLQYELGKSLISTKDEKLEKEKKEEIDNNLSQERINSIKDKFKSSQEIKPIKHATKEDVENFYLSQKNSINKDKKIEK